ncbi:MAG: hypothetical protein Q9213_004020 [Squamulea squamosa]
MAICRIVFMGMLLLLLSVAFEPTGYLSQRNNTPQTRSYADFVASPAICLFMPRSRSAVFNKLSILGQDDGLYSGEYESPIYNKPIVVLSLAYLITSYLTRVIRISAPLSRFFRFWLENVPMDYLRNYYRQAKNGLRLHNHRFVRHFVTAVLLLMITLAEGLYEAGNSVIWEIVWLSAALIWGTLRLVGLRIQTHVTDENRWGFGQILPLVLSILPIWCLLNTPWDAEPVLQAKDVLYWNGQKKTSTSTFRRIKRTVWFRILTILIIGSATVLAAYLLFDLPGAVIFYRSGSMGVDALQYGGNFGWILLKYVFAVAFCSFVQIIFVCICLAVRWGTHRPIKNPSKVGRRLRIPDFCKEQNMQNALWLSVVIAVLALEVALIITMLIYPALLFRALFSA